MDHLESPKDRLELGFRIPALAPNRNLSFNRLEAVPSQFGLSLNPEGLLTFSELQRGIDPSHAAAFVQEWLFFGTLRYILGEEYSYQDFVHTEGETRYVTTARLKDYEIASPLGLGTWTYSKAVRHGRERFRAYDRWERVSTQLTEIDKPWDAAGEYWPMVMLSISVLSWLFKCRPWNRQEFTYRRPRSIATASSRFLRSLLLSRPGWCTHEFEQLRIDFSDEQLIYLASMRRYPRSWVDHMACQSTTKCIGYNIDNETFQGFHTTDNCSCSRIEAPVEDMYDILREGGIPYIQCSLDDAGELLLQYRRATPCTRFIAISHLWADGLGNPTGNSLYHCQLHRLLFQLRGAESFTRQLLFTHGLGSASFIDIFKHFVFKGVCGRSYKATKALPEGLAWSSVMEPGSIVNFWLDVYSIPVPLSGDSRAAELLILKLKALSNMTLTYALAQSVLALDHEFDHITTEMDETEILARIAFCGWNSRCWTFQEAVLANILVYWCGDHPSAIAPWARTRKTFTGQRELKRWGLEPNPKSTLSTVWLDALVSALRERIESPSGIYDHLNSKRTPPRLTGDHPSAETRRILNNPAPGPWHEGWQHLLRAEQFTWAWNALRLRTTTKAEDMAMIMANLLGMDGADILGLPPDDRLKAILNSCRIIPADTLFRHDGFGRTDPVPQRISSVDRFEEPRQGCGYADITHNGIVLLPGLPHGSKHSIKRRPWRLLRIDRAAATWDCPRCAVEFAVWDVGAYQSTSRISVSPSSYDLSKLTEAQGSDVYLVLGSYDNAPLVVDGEMTKDFAQYGMCLVQPRVDGTRLLADYAFPILWFKFDPGDASTAAISMPEEMEVVISSDVSNWPRCRIREDILGRAHGDESHAVMFLVLVITMSCTLGIWWASFGRFADEMSTSAYAIWSLIIMISLATLFTMLNMTIVQIVRSAQHWLKLLEYEQPDVRRLPWWLALHRARPDAQSWPYIGGGGFSLYALEPLILICTVLFGRNRIWRRLSGLFRRVPDGEIALEQTDEEPEHREGEEQSRRRNRAWEAGKRFGQATFVFARGRLVPLFTIPMGWILNLSDRIGGFQATQNERRLARTQRISLE